MKKTLLSLFSMILLAATSYGQITTSSASFPVVGDTLYLAVDDSPYIFVQETPTGSAMTWDFTDLNLERLALHEVIAAADGDEGARFPDADIILPFYNGDGYAKVYADSIEIIGYAGSPYDRVSSFYAITDIDPTFSSYIAGLTFGDTYVDSIYFHSEQDGSQIDPSETFGIQADSIRYTYDAVRLDTVDAYGTMTTPTGTFDVVRIKQTLYSDVQIAAKQGFFGWVEFGDLDIEGTGKDTTITYIWWSNSEKEAIAKVEKRPNGSNFYCEYKIDRATAIMVPTTDITAQKSIIAYPNPAVNNVNFEFRGLTADRYTLSLFNIIGRKLLSKELQINGTATMNLNLRPFGKGVYLYSLADSQGKIIKTSQLIINRP